jgi:S1-C subfamily serine protease
VRRPQVEVAPGRSLDAVVVLFDPARDVAVLAVEGLRAPQLAPAAQEAERDQGAVVVGYPQDGPFSADEARVIRTQRAPRQGHLPAGGRRPRDLLGARPRPAGQLRRPARGHRGDVLGVVFAAAADDQTIGYVLTWDEVAEAAEQGPDQHAPVSTRDCG